MASPAPLQLLDLPTEVIEQISEYLDDDAEAWGALRLTCRALRSKTMFPFGKQFFHTIKFNLHPYSLNTLADISQHAEFARHIRIVAFGAENSALFDPQHDPEVVLAGLMGHKVSIHKPTYSPGFDNSQDLYVARYHHDSRLISEALHKFPNVKLVLVGNELEVNDRAIRPSWGLKHTLNSRFHCYHRHCQETQYSRFSWVFVTVTGALWLAKKSDICFGASIPERRSHSDGLNFGVCPILQGLQPYQVSLRPRMTHLKLNLMWTRFQATQRSTHPLANIYPFTRIESLVVDYHPLMVDYHRQRTNFPTSPDFLPIHHGILDFPPDLSNLRSITLKEGLFTAKTLIAFFQAHSYLEKVSLVHITIPFEVKSSILPGALTMYDDGNRNRWRHVFTKLQTLSHLTYLNMDHLGRPDCRDCDGNRWPPVQLDPSMTRKATWTKDEIATGLQWLLKTYGPLMDAVQTNYDNEGLAPRVETKALVDFRWANFKVSPRYSWTRAEIETLRGHRIQLRHRGDYLSKILVHQAGKRYCDLLRQESDFPVPQTYFEDHAELPPGWTALPGSLQSRAIWWAKGTRMRKIPPIIPTDTYLAELEPSPKGIFSGYLG